MDKQKDYKGKIITITMKKGWIILLYVIIILSLGISILAYSETLSNNKNIIKLINNNGFSEVSNKISNSTVLILVQKEYFNINNQQSEAIYVDENSVGWATGTAFSIGDGVFLSASHILEGENDMSKIKIVWNGKEYNNIVKMYYDAPNYDIIILVTNLKDVIPVNIIKDKATIGNKIGFIGYPLGETKQILHDGVVSSIKEENDGFFWYTINSFVNKGNSGGSVFLADTGEVIGIVSSKQYEPIALPTINESKLSDGEKELVKLQLFISSQLMTNSQVGIGQVVGLNQIVVNNIKSSINY